MVDRWRLPIGNLLSETHHQGSTHGREPNASRSKDPPLLHRRLRRALGLRLTTGPPTNGDAPIDDKNGSLVFDGINCPLRAAHRRYRLWCSNLKSFCTRSLRHLEQQGLTA